MLWSTTGRRLIKVTLLTSVSCSPESPIVRRSSSQACQQSDYSHPGAPLSLRNFFHSSLFWYFIPRQHLFLPFPSPPHSAGFMYPLSTSSYLSTPWVHPTMSQAIPLSHKSVVLPVSAISGQDRGYITLLCFGCQSHELLSANTDAENMRAKMGNYIWAI